jgi:hypothetical protein
MSKKESKVDAKWFEADLEMERISKYSVRYLVKNPIGLKVQNLSTVDISRSDFPKDDDYSMDFINSDIPAIAKSGDKDIASGVAKLLKKQADFRTLKNLKLYIVAE